MKRFIIIVSVIFCGCLITYGQAPAPTPFSEEWQTPVFKNEEFTIEVPVKLDSDEYPGRKEKDDRSIRYRNSLNGTFYFIFSEDHSDLFMSNIGLAFIRQFDENGRKISFGDTEGRKFDFADDEGFYHKAVLVKTKKISYLFHAVSSNSGDAAARRFISSLKIAGVPYEGGGDSTPERIGTFTQTKTPIQNEFAPAADRGSGKGRGEAPGFDPGLPSASSGPESAKRAAGVKTPIKILSKPRASYTDAARVYSSEGTVDLRVTFLASGKLGAIVPVTKLPFGLTKAAMAAAAAVTFEPAKTDGILYSVARTIRYGFSIY